MEEIRGKKVLDVGFWHKFFARWIVTVEEEQVVLDLGNGFVAEHQRLHRPGFSLSCGELWN